MYVSRATYNIICMYVRSLFYCLVFLIKIDCTKFDALQKLFQPYHYQHFLV